MKSNFKYVIVTIIGLLSLVFICQLFWLKGLYGTIKDEQERSVISCIDIANIDELQYRVDGGDKKPKGSSVTISKSIGGVNKEESKEATQTKQIIHDNDTVKTTSVSKDKNDLNIREMEELFKMIREAMHQALDSIEPIDMHILDSSIVANLQSNKIDSKLYYVEVVNLATDSVLHTTRPDSISLGRVQPYIYKFDSDNDLAYRIYIEPLTKSVLKQMSGILGTTLLIALLLSFAFWYLIKTIIRQRTLEEMKDDFTNNMTHELKTPIAVAYSATDALLNFKQGDNKEKRDKYLSICKDQLVHLTGLVEQILSMSMERRQTFVLNKENIVVRDFIDIIVEQHRLKAGKEVVFDINIDSEDLIINADRTHFNNMISNLIDNAIKYSSENAEIGVEIYRKDSYNIISVKDNGIGISSERQNYIFDKFYRVPTGNRQNVKGYGLGLFYVKTMTEKHGGTVSVESIPGGGSTFTIKIPD